MIPLQSANRCSQMMLAQLLGYFCHSIISEEQVSICNDTSLKSFSMNNFLTKLLDISFHITNI